MTNIPDISAICDETNKAGLKAFLHAACRKCVATIPAAVDHVVSDDITMRAADAGPPIVDAGTFGKWELSTDFAKNTFATEAGGDTDTVFHTTTVVGFIPGISSDIINGLKKAEGPCGAICIVPDENGNQRILGDLERGATIRHAEAVNGDTAGVTVTITYRSAEPPLFYTGVVPA